MRFFLDTANIDEICQAAKAGARIATIPFKALTQMMHHPLTDLGMARFTQDWETAAKQELTLQSTGELVTVDYNFNNIAFQSEACPSVQSDGWR